MHKLNEKKLALAQKMINGSTKSFQKGKQSLNRPSKSKNEGETMTLGRDEHSRA